MLKTTLFALVAAAVAVAMVRIRASKVQRPDR